MTGSSWIAGALFGVLDGFLLFELPILGLGLLLVATLLALLGLRARRDAGLGGLAIGSGGTVVTVLLNARFQCSTGAWQGCTEGSLTVPYLVAGAVILAIGIALTSVARFRRHS